MNVRGRNNLLFGGVLWMSRKNYKKKSMKLYGSESFSKEEIINIQEEAYYRAIKRIEQEKIKELEKVDSIERTSEEEKGNKILFFCDSVNYFV